MSGDATLLPRVERVRALLDDLVWQCTESMSYFLRGPICLFERFESLEKLAKEARAQLLSVAQNRGPNVTAIPAENGRPREEVPSC
jgi:hypothetical protein